MGCRRHRRALYHSYFLLVLAVIVLIVRLIQGRRVV